MSLLINTDSFLNGNGDLNDDNDLFSNPLLEETPT